jgi:hypothetical protein
VGRRTHAELSRLGLALDLCPDPLLVEGIVLRRGVDLHAVVRGEDLNIVVLIVLLDADLL